MKTLRYVVLLLLLLCLTAGTAHAATIKLTSPNGGENWTIGSTHNITWTLTNPSSVKLELLKGNSILQPPLATIPKNQTTYSWEVGKNGGGTPGTDYKIQVTNLTTGDLDTSDANFSISIFNVGISKQWNNLNALCLIVNCQGSTTPPDVTGLMLKSVEGTVTPGGTLLLKGQGFGNNPGKVYMSPNSSGGSYKISKTELPTGGWWGDKNIFATVPTTLTGYIEQSVTIGVETADQKVSNIVFATFYPEMHFIALANGLGVVNTACGAGESYNVGVWNECNTNTSSEFSFLGQHENCALSSFNPVIGMPISGFDTWALTLINGWVVDGIYDVTYDRYKADANISNSKIIPGSKDIYIQVDFSMDALVWGDYCPGVRAQGKIGIKGPKGVHYW